MCVLTMDPELGFLEVSCWFWFWFWCRGAIMAVNVFYCSVSGVCGASWGQRNRNTTAGGRFWPMRKRFLCLSKNSFCSLSPPGSSCVVCLFVCLSVSCPRPQVWTNSPDFLAAASADYILGLRGQRSGKNCKIAKVPICQHYAKE